MKETLLILEVQIMEEAQSNNIQFKALITQQLEWFNLNTELNKQEKNQQMIEEEQHQEHMDLLIQDIQAQVLPDKHLHINLQQEELEPEELELE